MARPSRDSHAIELALFLWHMPEDATEYAKKYGILTDILAFANDTYFFDIICVG